MLSKLIFLLNYLHNQENRCIFALELRNKVYKEITDMATTNKIETALQIMNQHDWYWCMSDSNSAYGKAYSNMRMFVELVAGINDTVVVKALRDLWTAHYEFIKATMFNSNEAAKAEFKAKEAELMAAIKPQFATAA